MKKATAVMEPISLDESKRFIELEARVKAGVETFKEVGLALEEIRDRRLYRADFSTFQAYCEKRWNFKRGRAYQLITAAATVRALPEPMSTLVDTEKAARALNKARSRGTKTPEMRRVERMLAKAVESKKRVTEKDIKNAASKPIPRGGLAAEALRAQRGETEPERPVKPALPNPVIPAEVSLDPLTPRQFQQAVEALEARIPEGDNPHHQKYGVILNAAANRQMNWGKTRSHSAYVS